jgi:hypothetical protein
MKPPLCYAKSLFTNGDSQPVATLRSGDAWPQTEAVPDDVWVEPEGALCSWVMLYRLQATGLLGRISQLSDVCSPRDQQMVSSMIEATTAHDGPGGWAPRMSLTPTCVVGTMQIDL